MDLTVHWNVRTRKHWWCWCFILFLSSLEQCFYLSFPWKWGLLLWPVNIHWYYTHYIDSYCSIICEVKRLVGSARSIGMFRTNFALKTHTLTHTKLTLIYSLPFAATDNKWHLFRCFVWPFRNPCTSENESQWNVPTNCCCFCRHLQLLSKLSEKRLYFGHVKPFTSQFNSWLSLVFPLLRLSSKWDYLTTTK